MNDNQVGVYGKLPGYGDFIHRSLPTPFINEIDSWLQLYVASSHEKLGDSWLDIYLTSPIWRFVLSAGVIDEQHWAGIMLPSVDQVGRYYPLVMAIPVDARCNPYEFISSNSAWFEQIEDCALLALDAQVSVEQLVEMANEVAPNVGLNYLKTGQQMSGEIMQINMQFAEELPTSVYANLLDSLMVKTMNSYSVWTTTGSENIAPCLFMARGMPNAQNIPAMMDGHWAHWGWPQTYTANRFNDE